MSIQKIESILTQKNIGTLINSLNQILKLKSAINDLKILATELTKENKNLIYFVENMNQPYAHLTVKGDINIINKNFPTDFRDTIKIRGNDILKGVEEFTETQLSSLPEILQRRINNKNFVINAIIGEVEIVDCVINHSSIWAESSGNEKPIYNWVLANPKLYDEPIDDMTGDFSYYEFLKQTQQKFIEILQEINIDEVDELLIEQGQFTEEFNSVLCDLSYNNKEIADL